MTKTKQSQAPTINEPQTAPLMVVDVTLIDRHYHFIATSDGLCTVSSSETPTYTGTSLTSVKPLLLKIVKAFCYE